MFEVKFWRDRIKYLEGQWSYDPPHPERDKKPDQQWIRMADDVRSTLHRREGFLIAQVPELQEIHGGIVFAHGSAQLDIADCPVEWGNVDDWRERLLHVAPSPRVEGADVMTVIEALLTEHHGIEAGGVRSMDRYAEQVVQEAEARLEAWISE